MHHWPLSFTLTCKWYVADSTWCLARHDSGAYGGSIDRGSDRITNSHYVYADSLTSLIVHGCQVCKIRQRR